MPATTSSVAASASSGSCQPIRRTAWRSARRSAMAPANGLSVFVTRMFILSIGHYRNRGRTAIADTPTGANAGSGRKSLTGDHDNAAHERIDSDQPGSEEAVAKMHGRLAALRRVSPPGHLQAVGQRSRVARQPRAGSTTSEAPAEPPVRSRGAFCDELRIRDLMRSFALEL